MKTKKLENIEGLITDFLSKEVSVLGKNTLTLSSDNPQMTQDYLKNSAIEKAKNGCVNLEVLSLSNSRYQDGDMFNFLGLKDEIISNSEKKYLVLKTFENNFYVSDKKFLSAADSLNKQSNYMFVGLFKK